MKRVKIQRKQSSEEISGRGCIIINIKKNKKKPAISPPFTFIRKLDKYFDRKY